MQLKVVWDTRYCDIFSIEIKNKKLLPNGVAQWVRAFTTNES